MSSTHLTRSAILMIVLVIVGIAAWEFYLRSKGVTVAYDDGGPLWSDKRAMVYEPADKSTVFIGSSRIKFDLDQDVWKDLTGDHAIMLAIEGSSPVPLLHDLANDEKFKGRLVVDVTEPLFFSNAPNFLASPNDYIKYYKDRTPAQRASFQLSHFLESNFVFLDKDNYSLNAELEKLNVKNRKGVYVFPCFPGFPMEFGRNTFDRRALMTDKFVADTNLHNQVTDIWKFVFSQGKDAPPPTQGSIDTVILSVKASTDKIVARGGQVIFVRTPASPPMSIGENMGFPRERYWDKLLSVTGCQGIHYQDYPSLSKFICPEWSHLAPKDGITFTSELARILQVDKGWKFPKPYAG